MRKKRHHYSPEEKVAILRRYFRYFMDHVPVSNVCDEYQLQPTVFYEWQKQFFENGAAAVIRDTNHQKRKEAQRIEQFEAKLHRKDEVLAELMEEYIQLKKELVDL